jgi:Zn ribbon nucleic-acid-binding protein
LPFKDELFSSWIVRTAYAHKTHPHTFANQYLDYRQYAFFSGEEDFTLDERMIQVLESKSLHKIDIRSLFLKTYSGYLQESIYDNPNRFISHLKYCPVCLREDKVPYFRKKWRVVFYNICHEHKCYLYENCPQCRKKLDISKMYNNKLAYIHCYNCGFELKKSRRRFIHKKYRSSIDYQNKLMAAVDSGYITLGKYEVYSFLFLNVFMKFAKLILKDKKYQFIQEHPLYDIIKKAKQNDFNHPIHKRIDLKAQSALFGLIMYIFDNFPINLKQYVLQNELTYYNMTTKIDKIPFWYKDSINDIVPQYTPHSMTVTKQEVENAIRYLKSIGKEANKTNLSKLMGCNFFSEDNDLKKYIIK